tara:strand:+ start:61 stop:345 length:285 start_codon:yes stop_codon:yes gene_type:complete
MEEKQTRNFGLLEHYLMQMLFMNHKTKSDICADLGVSRQTFYNWIRAIHVPSFQNVMEMASILAKDEEEVLKISRQIWICIFEDQISIKKEVVK